MLSRTSRALRDQHVQDGTAYSSSQQASPGHPGVLVISRWFRPLHDDRLGLRCGSCCVCHTKYGWEPNGVGFSGLKPKAGQQVTHCTVVGSCLLSHVLQRVSSPWTTCDLAAVPDEPGHLTSVGGRPHDQSHVCMPQNVVELLDDLFARAAVADEPDHLNFIAKHARQMTKQGLQATSSRLFSQPAGALPATGLFPRWGHCSA